jgi:hypothetical protein
MPALEGSGGKWEPSPRVVARGRWWRVGGASRERWWKVGGAGRERWRKVGGAGDRRWWKVGGAVSRRRAQATSGSGTTDSGAVASTRR